MAKARKILERLNSVRNIRTVTGTMEMVSRARFKRLHNMALAVGPYSDSLSSMVHQASEHCPDAGRHGLLQPCNADAPAVMLVISSDRGLCGAYNASMFRMARDRRAELADGGREVFIRLVGKKSLGYFASAGIEPQKVYVDLPYAPDFQQISAMADGMMNELINGIASQVEVVCGSLVSAGSWKATIKQILPIPLERAASDSDNADADDSHYDFVPSVKEVLDGLLPAAVRQGLFSIFTAAATCEQLARITAMSAATENADEMIRSLNLAYNRKRQSQVTTELIEVVSGSAQQE